MKKIIGLLAVLGLVMGAVGAKYEAPNVILVITDDQGYGDLGCHGNTVLKTPVLDELHSQSVRLTDYHVDPTCSPTRAALMTGRYSSRTGVWHTIAGRSMLRRDEVTIADLFKAGGYKTGIFGKWHLGDNYPFRPQDRGFEETLIHGGGGVGQTPDYWGNDYFDDTYFVNGKPKKFEGYCTDVFIDGAIRFIEKNRAEPFFCYIPTNVPHGPYYVADEYKNRYEGKTAAFYGMLAHFDEALGRLLAKVKDLGLEENTLVIFTTDNGTAGAGFNSGMRGKKGSEYDGGHRVPCFWKWPAGGMGEARDVNELTAHIDMLPTLVELCELDKPKRRKVDGKSLVPLLRGKKGWKERTLFVHSQRINQPEKWRKSSVMTEQWRLVNGKELFDIKADPGQKRNLASSKSRVVAQLRGAYDKWWKDLSKRFDEYTPIVLGASEENPANLTCHDWFGKSTPWHQRMVQRAPKANGHWVVEVAKSGKYRVTLRQRPAVAKFAIEGKEARLKFGKGKELRKPIEEGATSVAFELELKKGETTMETGFVLESGERGAFFVEVERL